MDARSARLPWTTLVLLGLAPNAANHLIPRAGSRNLAALGLGLVAAGGLLLAVASTKPDSRRSPRSQG